MTAVLCFRKNVFNTLLLNCTVTVQMTFNRLCWRIKIVKEWKICTVWLDQYKLVIRRYLSKGLMCPNEQNCVLGLYLKLSCWRHLVWQRWGQTVPSAGSWDCGWGLVSKLKRHPDPGMRGKMFHQSFSQWPFKTRMMDFHWGLIHCWWTPGLAKKNVADHDWSLNILFIRGDYGFYLLIPQHQSWTNMDELP